LATGSRQIAEEMTLCRDVARMGWIGPITLETFAGDLLTSLSAAVLLGLAFAAVRTARRK
jgi:hypothetical protein